MKLFLIVLKSLGSGLKIPQACHAMNVFQDEHPEITGAWKRDNNLVVLQHDDLAVTCEELRRQGLTFSVFHEPDRDNELTAICAEPAAKHALRRYELAS